MREGYKPGLSDAKLDFRLGPIAQAFPGNCFPVGAIHEFLCYNQEDFSSTQGFVSSLLATLMHKSGIIIWIGDCRQVFPPALKAFGIKPQQVIFIPLYKEKEILWTLEEALKCKSICAVVGALKDLSFTACRRLQLAVEQSQVTGFVLRYQPGNTIASGFVARWQITSLPALVPEGMPGVGFPTWNVSLLKVRNGRTGSWDISFVDGAYQYKSKTPVVIRALHSKTG